MLATIGLISGSTLAAGKVPPAVIIFLFWHGYRNFTQHIVTSKLRILPLLLSHRERAAW
jgi:hypothetical protein